MLAFVEGMPRIPAASSFLYRSNRGGSEPSWTTAVTIASAVWGANENGISKVAELDIHRENIYPTFRSYEPTPSIDLPPLNPRLQLCTATQPTKLPSPYMSLSASQR